MHSAIQLILAVIAGIMVTACIESRQEIGPEVIRSDAGPQISGTSIVEIVSGTDAFNFKDKEVIVSGKVMPGLAFEFISEQPYQIIQGETLLWVITDKMAPKEGSFVTVRGRIARPYQIKGRSYEVALLEEERL